MKFLIPLLSAFGGILVGVGWNANQNISLGEASCGAVLTMILIFIIGIWFELMNNKKLKWRKCKNGRRNESDRRPRS